MSRPMRRLRWRVIHPTKDEAMPFFTKSEATKWAISSNRASSEHWAFELWKTVGGDEFYHGTLYRKFGEDFNPKNCWDMSVTPSVKFK